MCRRNIPNRVVLAAFATVLTSVALHSRAGTEKKQEGEMSFDRHVIVKEVAERTANVSLGDLDGDQDLDLVFAQGRHWPLTNSVFLNSGQGTFSSERQLDQRADRSYSAVLSDIDRDGDLDVIVSNDAPDPKRVYSNDGTGAFRLGGTFGRPSWPTRNASVADLDGDQLPDIIVANRTARHGGSNFVCLNLGGGRFETDCTAFSSESATTISPVDFDGDGAVDLVVPHRDGGQSYVYFNDGAASFGRRLEIGPSAVSVRAAEVADLDGDGALDLITIDTESGVTIALAKHGDSFVSRTPLGDGSHRPYSLRVADLDTDGDADVIVGYVTSPTIVFFNQGEAKSFVSLELGDTEGTAYGIAVGDVDRDGVLDIAIAKSDAPNVLFYGRTNHLKR